MCCLCRNWLSASLSHIITPVSQHHHGAATLLTAVPQQQHFAVLAAAGELPSSSLSQTVSTVFILRSRKQAPTWCGLILIWRQVWMCHVGKLVFLAKNAQYEEMRMSMGILCVCSYEFCKVCSNISSVIYLIYMSIYFIASPNARCRKKCSSLMPMNIIKINCFLHVGALQITQISIWLVVLMSDVSI